MSLCGLIVDFYVHAYPTSIGRLGGCKAILKTGCHNHKLFFSTENFLPLTRYLFSWEEDVLMYEQLKKDVIISRSHCLS